MPLGVVAIDRLLGGGVPRGKLVEIFGEPASGKTTLAALAARAFQEAGQLVIYLDYEHAVDLAYLRQAGIRMDAERLWLFDQPFSLESGMTAALKLVGTGKVGLLVVDSVAAMAPQAELEGNLEEATVALQARQMARALRSLVGLLNRTGTAAIFLNQVRDKIGWTPTPWDKTTTPGGRALKFYASVRVELKKVAPPSEEKHSSTHRATLRKQRLSPLQFGVAQFHIGPHGIDPVENLARCLVDLGLASKEKDAYTLDVVPDDRAVVHFAGSYQTYLDFCAKHRGDLESAFTDVMTRACT